MRLAVALGVVALMLAGCTSSAGSSDPSRAIGTGTPSSVATSIGVDVPPDDPTLQRVDSAGRLPEQSLLALIEAQNNSDWSTAYSMYASPTADFATAAREWANAHETHGDFLVREVRVTGPSSAWVRVTYSVTDDPLSSAQPPFIVGEPGEWWPLHKVDGVWKTQWMPRQ